MWAGLYQLIKDSIPNCLHSEMKKKEEINPERNTCLFLEWLMGWCPVQAEKRLQEFWIECEPITLVGMQQNSKEDIRRLQHCGSRVSLLRPDYTCNIINCALYLHCSFNQWSQRTLQRAIKRGHIFHWGANLGDAPPSFPPFPVFFVRYISVCWIVKSGAWRQSQLTVKRVFAWG